ncbi:hypothetical protein LCGC14_0563890 [marine sediment metagenome]|uniref:Uncharacterized protein n=1 Tax=marine sediment metagenome TaxID=412755 RepID=A0A0F9U7P1_9ZZZZ
MSEEALKNKIRELELGLENKEQEIEELEEKIEPLENKIMELESFIPEEGKTKKSKKIQALEAKHAYYLEEKDKEIREMKNNMGLLRKEKTQLQQEIENFRISQQAVIRVEDLREKSPLNSLVAELQDKLNNQNSLIRQLNTKVKHSEKFSELLKEKENIIKAYRSEINALNHKLSELSTTSEHEKSGTSVAKTLIEDLQTQLNKSKNQILTLKQKVSKYEKKSKKSEKKEVQSKINKLETQNTELNELLTEKDSEIINLKNEISSVSKRINSTNLDQPDNSSSEMIKTLKEDLQNQLNKSKLQVKSLQEHISKLKTGESSRNNESNKEIEGKLKMQREMAIFLQKQLEAKEGEIETIKNEAVQIKKRYRQLENQVNSKDQKFNDLQRQVEKISTQTSSATPEDPHLALRLRELKGINQDLQSKNRDLKYEIIQLRKN